MSDDAIVKPGHGDHWLAALPEDDPRLAEALAAPLDAPDRLALHRTPLTTALDQVQVTHQRRLVTSYPEPRATTLLEGRPRELILWDTRVEGWLVLEHPTIGALTIFLSDLAERANRYAAHAGGPLRIEVGALAYVATRVSRAAGPSRLRPAGAMDARFLPDDYAFEGDVVDIHDAGGERVIDVQVHGDVVLPVATRTIEALAVGDRVEGFLWLSGRWPDAS